MNPTLEIVLSILFVLFVIYMLYTSIRGIVRKRFNVTILSIISGVKARDAGIENVTRTFEGEKAVSAALVQLFVASLFSIAIIFALIDETNWISSQTLDTLVRVLIAVSALIIVVFIVRVENKRKKQKKLEELKK